LKTAIAVFEMLVLNFQLLSLDYLIQLCCRFLFVESEERWSPVAANMAPIEANRAIVSTLFVRIVLSQLGHITLCNRTTAHSFFVLAETPVDHREPISYIQAAFMALLLL